MLHEDKSVKKRSTRSKQQGNTAPRGRGKLVKTVGRVLRPQQRAPHTKNAIRV